jgi:hypothetical protein
MRKKKRVEDENEKGESNECVNHSTVLQYVYTLLDIMCQRGFKYSDITVNRKIHIIMTRSLNNLQKQLTITNCSSK